MEITIHRPTTRTRRFLVSAIVATLLLTLTPPVQASTYSGDHPGCVVAKVRGHLTQGATSGWIYLDLETLPRTWAKITEGEGKHVIRWSTWSGGIWAIGGTHPFGPASDFYVTCT